MIDKPSIAEIINRYVPLMRAGKEYTGLCPFHADKHPSLSVNEEKQVFHCFACGESGDVIDFVMRSAGVSFRQALAELGMDTTQPRRNDPRRRAALNVMRWAKHQQAGLNARIRDLNEQIEIADEVPNTE